MNESSKRHSKFLSLIFPLKCFSKTSIIKERKNRIVLISLSRLNTNLTMFIWSVSYSNYSSLYLIPVEFSFILKWFFIILLLLLHVCDVLML